MKVLSHPTKTDAVILLKRIKKEQGKEL